MSSQRHVPAALPPVSIEQDVWWAPGGGLDVVARWKIPAPTESQTPVVQPVTGHFMDWTIPAPILTPKRHFTKY
jgi:hypothetical protein